MNIMHTFLAAALAPAAPAPEPMGELPREKSPKGGTRGWVDEGPVPSAGARATRFTLGHASTSRRGATTVRRSGSGVVVVSSLDIAEMPDGNGVGPQWHLSISVKGHRATDQIVARVLADFDVVGAEEDNHHPGRARHFFQPVDPARRVDCQCKADEDTVVERDGYRWTNPTAESGEACRGCEWAAGELGRGKPCPIHGAPKAGCP